MLTIRKDLPNGAVQMPMRAARGFITAPILISVSEEGDP